MAKPVLTGPLVSERSADVERYPSRQDIAKSKAVTADDAVTTSRTIVDAMSIQATTVMVASLRDGGASGTIVWTMGAAEGSGDSQNFPHGLTFKESLYIDLISGTGTISVAYKE